MVTLYNTISINRGTADAIDASIILAAANLGICLGYFEAVHKYVRPTANYFAVACVNVAILKGCALLGKETCSYPFSPSVYHLFKHGLGGDLALPPLLRSTPDEQEDSIFSPTMPLDAIIETLSVELGQQPTVGVSYPFVLPYKRNIYLVVSVQVVGAGPFPDFCPSSPISSAVLETQFDDPMVMI